MKHLALAALSAGVAIIAVASPAQAVTCVNPSVYPESSTSSGGTALASDVGTGTQVVACLGKYNYGVGNGNNLLNNSGSNPARVEAALSRLGLDIDVDGTFWNAPKKVSSISGNILDFGTELFGDTYIGVHWGGNEGTAFYLLHFDTPTTQIAINRNRFSGGVLFSTELFTPPAVPEPASWAMLIAGMGIVGFAMRRRKTTVAFA